MRGALVELRALDGRAVLVRTGPDPADPTVGDDVIWVTEIDDGELGLPSELVVALREWARVVDAVLGGPGSRPGEAARLLVTRRGRQLARRLAEEADATLGFVDPVTGTREWVAPRRPVDPRGVPTPGDGVPYGTGLTVTVIIGIVSLLIMVWLSRGLARSSVPLAVIANLLVGGGLAPSLWLSRGVPTWRWIALGAGCGIALSWATLLVMAVSPG